MYPVLLALAQLPAALARDLPDGYTGDLAKPLAYPLGSVAPAPVGERRYDVEVGLRLRWVALPNGILDTWFASEADADWAWVGRRPEIRGTAFGAEVGLRGRTASGTFYAEFVDSAIRPGYWDDADTNWTDGNYLVPSNGLGLVTLGANSAYELHLLDVGQARSPVGLSVVVGGGLGLGVLVGGVKRWVEDDLGNPSYARYLDGEPPDSTNGVSRLYPLLDVNVGVRAMFGELVSWRVEGGLHTVPFLGSTVAVAF